MDIIHRVTDYTEEDQRHEEAQGANSAVTETHILLERIVDLKVKLRVQALGNQVDAGMQVLVVTDPVDVLLIQFRRDIDRLGRLASDLVELDQPEGAFLSDDLELVVKAALSIIILLPRQLRLSFSLYL